ncbi:hypothetical protein LF817_09010 [Halobacillus sp. A1]|uniref:hypothetical protein n=1 Tax=Halobacillus sp. A1 TaxID=2880262 RepID=UPI0020A61E86|nr:hypothetical protein [Halobacillus sp. A1]MCP3031486.1 hypothetical protein [Halobacillus sp. A1]
MFYLLFALFFIIFLVAGYFTPLEITSVGASLAIAMIIGNLFMYVKTKKENKE